MRFGQGKDWLRPMLIDTVAGAELSGRLKLLGLYPLVSRGVRRG